MSWSISYRYSLLIAAVCLLIIPSETWACPLCFASSNASVLSAFYLTTVLLILLPLGAVGFVALTLARFRKRDPSIGPV